MLSLFTYIAMIAGINWLYELTPLVRLTSGDLWSPVDLIVGFVFVVRDFAQRKIGHHILWAMLAGIIISWWTVSPQLALASTVAFAVGELSDWALYTFTRKPFSQRILTSSLLAAPLDSLVFLSFMGLAAPLAMCAQICSKLSGALLVFFLVRRRERKSNESCGLAA